MDVHIRSSASAREQRVDSFPFNEVYRTGLPRLLSIYFFSPNGDPNVIVPPCTSRSIYSSLAGFNIAKRNCSRCTGSRPAQEGCPRCAIVSIPSAFRMMHRCRGFAAAAALLLLLQLLPHARARQRMGQYNSLKNVNCNDDATAHEHDATSERKQSVIARNYAIAQRREMVPRKCRY